MDDLEIEKADSQLAASIAAIWSLIDAMGDAMIAEHMSVHGPRALETLAKKLREIMGDRAVSGGAESGELEGQIRALREAVAHIGQVVDTLVTR